MSILKCPFCSSHSQNIGFSISFRGINRYVFCRCGASGPVVKGKSEAISAWNSRMKVFFYDPETINSAGERKRTKAYIESLTQDGFTVVTIPCRSNEQEPTK